ncbi:hypothetical protein [Sphingomonas sp.]|uniref:hypothetical protein n=1 Tax=Sphingomonas sp. TaxID=28214 RepID=UPI00286DF80D|nr:hypothetical protein [Sphingomonas sp.]
MHKWIIGAAALASALATTPALAQDSSYKLGPLWTAARIDVVDGQYENYMDWLNKTWVDNQAFAKSQGWILDYYILDNINPRDGEPDLILLTRFADYPSVKESDRRSAILNKRMNQDDHSAEAASGQRGSMRKLMGSVLYRELQKK